MRSCDLDVTIVVVTSVEVLASSVLVLVDTAEAEDDAVAIEDADAGQLVLSGQSSTCVVE